MTPRGGRTAAARPADAARHWQKANQFLAAARHDRAGAHWDAAVSNAILAGIHAADAVAIHYTGRRSASDRHDEAADRVERLSEVDADVRSRFAAHLRALLEVKSLVQYSGEMSRSPDADDAIRHAERGLSVLQALAEAVGWDRP